MGNTRVSHVAGVLHVAGARACRRLLAARESGGAQCTTVASTADSRCAAPGLVLTN
jgi:hypothetical protein